MKGSSLFSSETAETIVLAALVCRVPCTPSYTQAQACSTLYMASCGNDSDLTRTTRLPRPFVFRHCREHGLGFTEREYRARERLVRVIIVRRGRVRVRERWWHTARYGNEWRWRRATKFLEELSWVGVVASSGH